MGLLKAPPDLALNTSRDGGTHNFSVPVSHPYHYLSLYKGASSALL